MKGPAMFMIYLVMSISILVPAAFGQATNISLDSNTTREGGDDVNLGENDTSGLVNVTSNETVDDPEPPEDPDPDDPPDQPDPELPNTPPSVSEVRLSGITQFGEFEFTSVDGTVQFEFSATDVEDGANLQTEVLVTMPNGAQVPASASCTDGTCTGVTSTIPEAGTVTVFVTATDSRGESASNQGAIQAIPKADSSGISGDF